MLARSPRQQANKNPYNRQFATAVSACRSADEDVRTLWLARGSGAGALLFGKLRWSMSNGRCQHTQIERLNDQIQCSICRLFGDRTSSLNSIFVVRRSTDYLCSSPGTTGTHGGSSRRKATGRL